MQELRGKGPPRCRSAGPLFVSLLLREWSGRQCVYAVSALAGLRPSCLRPFVTCRMHARPCAQWRFVRVPHPRFRMRILWRAFREGCRRGKVPHAGFLLLSFVCSGKERKGWPEGCLSFRNMFFGIKREKSFRKFVFVAINAEVCNPRLFRRIFLFSPKCNSCSVLRLFSGFSR